MKKTTKKSLAKIAMMLVTLAMVFGIRSFAGNLTFTPKTPSDPRAKNIANTIIGLIQFIGVAIALGMLIIIGIKYITAEPSEKANIKDQSLVYLFGAILIFAATGILEAVKGLVKNLENAQ